MRTLLLAILLAASEGLYLALVGLDAVNGVRPVALFLAILGGCFALYFTAYVVARSASTRQLAITVAGAVLFRLTLLPAGLPPDSSWSERFQAMGADWRGDAVAYERFQLFDDDIWRYLWDAHISATGGNPFVVAPADSPEVGSGRPDWESIRENINYAHVPTIYPPLAQFVFRMAYWLAPGSVLAMKLVVAGFDLLAYALILLTLSARKQPLSAGILYGWNPLVVKVFAGSGHIDAVLVAFLAATGYFLARRKFTVASVSLGLAIAAKFAPVVLLPFLARRVGWWRTAAAGLTAIACYLPFLGAKAHLFSGLSAFSSGWQFNSSLFRLFFYATRLFFSRPDVPARVLCGIAFAAALYAVYRRDDGAVESFPRVAVWALGLVLLCSPVVDPWYVTWLLPFAVIAELRTPLFFSAAVCLAFLVMVQGTEWPWAIALEYGSLALFAGREFPRVRAASNASRLLL